jgi:hypothetical protein
MGIEVCILGLLKLTFMGLMSGLMTLMFGVIFLLMLPIIAAGILRRFR